MSSLRQFWSCLKNIPAETYIFKRYAGHSKWANIKHTKSLKDLQKTKLFTRIAQYIKVAIQEGGSTNPEHNFKLAQVIAQGRRISMPMGTIENIIKSTQKDPTQSKPYLFEIRGPGGSIVLCETFSSNQVLTKNTIASILRKHRAKYSDTSISHLFDHKGLIETEIPVQERNKPEEELIEIATTHAIESGAEDVVLVNSDDSKFLRFISDDTSFWKVQTQLESLNYKIINASLDYYPINLVTLSESDLEVCHNLFEKLIKLDDVVRLHDNITE